MGKQWEDIANQGRTMGKQWEDIANQGRTMEDNEKTFERHLK